MKRVLLHSTLCTIAVTIAVLTFVKPGMAIAPDGQSAPDHTARAKEIFAANCVVCHGPDGRGSEMGKTFGVADLPSAKIQKQSNAMLAQYIADGKGRMPAWKATLTHQQILDLVQYIRVLGKQKPVPPPAQP